MSDTFTIEIPGTAMRFLEGSGPYQQWSQPAWATLNGPIATSVGRKLSGARARKHGYGEVYDLTGSREELEYLADMCDAGITVYSGGDKDPSAKAEADGCRKAMTRIWAALA